MGTFIEVVEISSGDVVERFPCGAGDHPVRILLINMNTDEFFVRDVEAES